MQNRKTVVVTGAAGLVGQNLVPRLKRQGVRIIAIDKHHANTATLRRLHPDITVLEADLAERGGWQSAFRGADVVVINHAQIGGLTEELFERNNVSATRNVIAAAKENSIAYVIHISSSVVNSLARDFYTESKKAQEKLVVDSGLPTCILRPTLMFGWFDRKHLGWLARFMQRTPVFPIPGNGRYLRQPLYAGDFCAVINSAVLHPRPGEAYNISGQSNINYIDLIRAVRIATGAKPAIVNIPFSLFRTLLDTYAVFDRNPPFTSKQLAALVTPDVFEVIDWPGIFDVRATPLEEALKETFQHPVYSKVTLEF